MRNYLARQSTLIVPVIVLALFSLFANAKGENTSRSNESVKSSYIGKRYTAFELNTGPSYKRVKLPDGGVLHYWRSDLAGYFSARDDGQGSRCELRIYTDKNGIITDIKMIEEGIACLSALR